MTSLHLFLSIYFWNIFHEDKDQWESHISISICCQTSKKKVNCNTNKICTWKQPGKTILIKCVQQTEACYKPHQNETRELIIMQEHRVHRMLLKELRCNVMYTCMHRNIPIQCPWICDWCIKQAGEWVMGSAWNGKVSAGPIQSDSEIEIGTCSVLLFRQYNYVDICQYFVVRLLKSILG